MSRPTQSIATDMNQGSPLERAARVGGAGERGAQGFTLVEMLVVLAIIGVLAAMTLPSFTKAGKGNITETATRQLMDDLAYARLKAMSGRSRVYVVFSPDLAFFLGTNAPSAALTTYMTTNHAANNLIGGQLTSYALFSPRMVGEQPGQSTPRYLTEWRSLPDGAFIPPMTFRNRGIFHNAFDGTTNLSPVTALIPLDDTPGATFAMTLPFIGFDESGRLLGRTTNIAISIVEGSIMHPKDATGQTNTVVTTDAVETAPPALPTGGIVPGVEYLVLGTAGSVVRYPPGGAFYATGGTFTGTNIAGNPMTNYTVAAGSPRVVQHYGVRVDWISGRARVVRPELP